MTIKDCDNAYKSAPSTGKGAFPKKNVMPDGKWIVELTGFRVPTDTLMILDGFILDEREGINYYGSLTEDVFSFRTPAAIEQSCSRLKQINELLGMEITPSQLSDDERFRKAYDGIRLLVEKSTNGQWTNWDYLELNRGNAPDLTPTDDTKIDKVEEEKPVDPTEPDDTDNIELDNDDPFKEDF